jgi:hypothetical protein
MLYRATLVLLAPMLFAATASVTNSNIVGKRIDSTGKFTLDKTDKAFLGGQYYCLNVDTKQYFYGFITFSKVPEPGDTIDWTGTGVDLPPGKYTPGVLFKYVDADGKEQPAGAAKGEFEIK